MKSNNARRTVIEWTSQTFVKRYILKNAQSVEYYSNQSIAISACHLGVSFTFEGYVAS